SSVSGVGGAPLDGARRRLSKGPRAPPGQGGAVRPPVGRRIFDGWLTGRRYKSTTGAPGPSVSRTRVDRATRSFDKLRRIIARVLRNRAPARLLGPGCGWSPVADRRRR